MPFENIRGAAFVRWLSIGPEGIERGRAELLLATMGALAPALAKRLVERPTVDNATPPENER